jgi:hypothetical protein
MKTLFDLSLILHFVGLASLLGGFLVQMSAATKVIVPAMVHGAWTMLVTGVLMVGLAEALEDEDVAELQMKFGVKGLILAVILTLVMSQRKKESIDKAIYFSIGGLALANVAIAVLWQVAA